ncbi:C-type lectin domain family 4 member K-like [Monodelphis domestica]|uniref:C-type lectin domain family 4 member K-like n=1 Tax=Monodelphis domestica TaxID=13616 RepID=UPI00028BD057|nr:C-type lectin domain family 4 member K-like [Monodelphis domestica]
MEATDLTEDDQQFFWTQGFFSKAKMRLSPGMPRLVRWALILLLSILVLSLVIVAAQCFQEKKHMSLEVKTLKDSLEKINTTYGVLKEHHESLSKIVSKNWKIYNGSLYYFSCDIKSWDEAEQFCVSQDSHLATVTSVGEQEFLYKTLKGERHWIGLNDRHTEDTWTWVDGTIYDAAQSKGFWIPGQPTNYLGKEDCVEMKMEALAAWNDENCQLKYKFICEKPLGSSKLDF